VFRESLQSAQLLSFSLGFTLGFRTAFASRAQRCVPEMGGRDREREGSLSSPRIVGVQRLVQGLVQGLV
jgi:hypothetical protein